MKENGILSIKIINISCIPETGQKCQKRTHDNMPIDIESIFRR